MKKVLTKILAIALICVITVTSMGTYGGEMVEFSTVMGKYAILRNIDKFGSNLKNDSMEGSES